MNYLLIAMTVTGLVGKEFNSPEEAADWAIAHYTSFILTDSFALWQGEEEWKSALGGDFMNYVFRKACSAANLQAVLDEI